MSSKGEMCTCCSCGYSWLWGTDGSHSCAKELRRTLERERAEHIERAIRVAADSISPLATRKDVALAPRGTVCLCGSTRLMDAFFEAGWQFSLRGWIVLSIGVCKHATDHGGEALGFHVAEMLDELHFRKIDVADLVFVLNVKGYIGESTSREIEYAEKKGKPVVYLEAPCAVGEDD